MRKLRFRIRVRFWVGYRECSGDIDMVFVFEEFRVGGYRGVSI